ncbi:hypothetical protein QR680_003979 [Steinernema hermaphroditum]|uniref:TAR DNA-binding protein 43 N-terminal domain-containing protein n=1 Tax=Steinernema hermaphroditum TaxID=289476 RepID=A0AA39HM91_9BILA|nr:hypothetical protein QR680_003979 [Steinernema hermaphroditum]
MPVRTIRKPTVVQQLNTFYASNKGIEKYALGKEDYLPINASLEDRMEHVRKNQTKIDKLMEEIEQLSKEEEERKVCTEVKIISEEDDDGLFLPICQETGCLKMSDLRAGFPQASGICFRADDGVTDRLHFPDDFGLISPPESGWDSTDIYVFYPYRDDSEDEE